MRFYKMLLALILSTNLANAYDTTIIYNEDKPIFKLDFKDGIPKNYKTMVVIPTILKNKEKVDKMFDTLEKYYLSNKSKNIYFTLLGDACECKTQNVPLSYLV